MKKVSLSSGSAVCVSGKIPYVVDVSSPSVDVSGDVPSLSVLEGPTLFLPCTRLFPLDSSCPRGSLQGPFVKEGVALTGTVLTKSSGETEKVSALPSFPST